MNFLIKIFIITVIFSFKINTFANENKIIFKINKSIYTDIDLERRYQYLEVLNNLEIKNLTNNERKQILDDYISTLIFFEYNKYNNIKFENIDNLVNNFYNLNFRNNLKIKSFNKAEINIIKDNIKLDLIRKKIIEEIINSKKSTLLDETNTLDLLYNYEFKKIIVNINEININDISNIKKFNDFIRYKKFLSEKNIDHLYYEKDINDNSKISKKIKNLINNNINIDFFIINDYVNLISINKNLESYEGVFVKLFNFKTDQPLEKQKLNCDFLNKLNDKTIYKEYEYSKLNKEVKENLKTVNDYIIFNNEADSYNYIFLCELRFDKSVLNEINFNKKVNDLANSIESKFLNEYKKIYKFEKL